MNSGKITQISDYTKIQYNLSYYSSFMRINNIISFDSYIFGIYLSLTCILLFITFSWNPSHRVWMKQPLYRRTLPAWTRNPIPYASYRYWKFAMLVLEVVQDCSQIVSKGSSVTFRNLIHTIEECVIYRPMLFTIGHTVCAYPAPLSESTSQRYINRPASQWWSDADN
jgi:hypothetical protein